MHIRKISMFVIMTLLLGMTSVFAQTTNRITGQLVYTAVLAPGDTLNGQIELPGSNAVLIANTIGADVVEGRDHIIGGAIGIAAHPRIAPNTGSILLHAFEDPDQNGMAVAEEITPILVLSDLTGTTVTRLTDATAGAALEPNWSLDRSQVVFAYANTDTNGDGIITQADRRQLALLDLNTASDPDVVGNIATLPTEEISIANPHFASDNLIVFDAVINDIKQVHTYNLETQELIPLVNAPGQTSSVSPSPDGNRLAVEIQENNNRYVAVHNLITDSWERISPPEVAAFGPVWVNDNVSYVVRDNDESQVMVWNGSDSRMVIERNEVIVAAKLAHLTDAIAYTYVQAENKNTILAVATLDGGYYADFSPIDSNVMGFEWAKTDLFD